MAAPAVVRWLPRLRPGGTCAASLVWRQQRRALALSPARPAVVGWCRPAAAAAAAWDTGRGCRYQSGGGGGPEDREGAGDSEPRARQPEPEPEPGPEPEPDRDPPGQQAPGPGKLSFSFFKNDPAPDHPAPPAPPPPQPDPNPDPDGSDPDPKGAPVKASLGFFTNDPGLEYNPPPPRPKRYRPSQLQRQMGKFGRRTPEEEAEYTLAFLHADPDRRVRLLADLSAVTDAGLLQRMWSAFHYRYRQGVPGEVDLAALAGCDAFLEVFQREEGVINERATSQILTAMDEMGLSAGLAGYKIGMDLVAAGVDERKPVALFHVAEGHGCVDTELLELTMRVCEHLRDASGLELVGRYPVFQTRAMLSAAVSLASHHDRHADVERIFTEIRRPSPREYSAVLHALASLGKPGTLLKVFDEFEAGPARQLDTRGLFAAYWAHLTLDRAPHPHLSALTLQSCRDAQLMQLALQSHIRHPDLAPTTAALLALAVQHDLLGENRLWDSPTSVNLRGLEPSVARYVLDWWLHHVVLAAEPEPPSTVQINLDASWLADACEFVASLGLEFPPPTGKKQLRISNPGSLPRRDPVEAVYGMEDEGDEGDEDSAAVPTGNAPAEWGGEMGEPQAWQERRTGGRGFSNEPGEERRDQDATDWGDGGYSHWEGEEGSTGWEREERDFDGEG